MSKKFCTPKKNQTICEDSMVSSMIFHFLSFNLSGFDKVNTKKTCVSTVSRKTVAFSHNNLGRHRTKRGIERYQLLEVTVGDQDCKKCQKKGDDFLE